MNENKFDCKAVSYAKARPHYPKALFDFLVEHNFINPNSIVADIASGTGIFTGQIADIVYKVYAVEPNRDMQREAERLFLNYSNIISITATAENTTLKDHSVDCVTAAQAFHWFERAAFKKECQKILKPNGVVILIWNDRDESSDIIKANFDINKKYCPAFKGSSNGMDYNSVSSFFTRELKKERFDNILLYDKETFINRSLSSSYAPKVSDDNYYSYVKELEQIFDKLSKNELIEYPYITRCYIGQI